MSTGRLIAHQLRYEQRTFWRNPAAVFFTVGLPVVMLVIFTTLNGDDVLEGGGRFGDYFVPGMITFGVINATFANLATKLVVRRESRLLKRARATPLPLRLLLAGMLLNAIIVAAVITAVVLLTGRLAYGVDLPTNWGLMVLVLLVGAASFAALGLALANFVPNADAADPMAFGIVLPLLFVSGVFDQVPQGSVLDRIADVFPVSHLFTAALSTTDAASTSPYGHLAFVALWGAAGAAVAISRFRWDPKSG